GNGSQLPEELNADFAELFGLLRARPVEGNANEAYNDEALRALNGDADDGMPVNVQDLVAQLDVIAPTGPHQYHHVGYLHLHKFCSPSLLNRIDSSCKLSFDAAHQIITESLLTTLNRGLIPYRRLNPALAISRRFEGSCENLDSDTAELINTFVAETEDELVYHDSDYHLPLKWPGKKFAHCLIAISTPGLRQPLDSTQTDSPKLCDLFRGIR
ncbi:hypothetical protein H4Q26_018015, partial [Puccinia striiformis f. sp. tritici PST-130]